MDRAQIAMLLHTLKGPGMSCLFAMLGIDKAMGTDELADITGYSPKTVAKGLGQLKDLKMVDQHRRYNGWYLTATGYQLALDLKPQTPGLPANGHEGQKLRHEGQKLRLEGQKLRLEGEKLPLAQRSSSSFKDSNNLNKELLLLDNEEEKLPLEGEKLLLAELLVKQGCPRSTAQPAVEAALIRGETPGYIEAQITAWLVYCRSDSGVGINNPPLFIAAKIKNGEPAPEIEQEDEPHLVEVNERGHLYSDGTYR
jgi:hypothetical protein